LKSILLAAGLGTRLRPITDHIPKCLVPINGKPLLGYWFDSLAKAGVGPILINLHHHSDKVIEFVKEYANSCDVRLVYEPELLGTGGTLKENYKFLCSESVLVAHADNFCLVDLKEFYLAHQRRPIGTEITMMTFVTDEPTSCGIVETDVRGRVIGYYEKVKEPPCNVANAAVYIFQRSVIEHISAIPNRFIDLSTDVLPEYLGKIFAWEADDIHIDIGTVKNLQKANAMMASRKEQS
tara:strand:+ start:5259 stop:5972 length:714 start_codon:yes stop_codon:yes gene_type:complete